MIGLRVGSVPLKNRRADHVFVCSFGDFGASRHTNARSSESFARMAGWPLLCGDAVSSPSVEVEGEAVDAQGVGEEIQALAVAADAVGSAQPEGVVEMTVDAFGVVPTPVEAVEVGIVGRDWAQVFGSVELALRVVGVAVETNGDRATAPPRRSRTDGQAFMIWARVRPRRAGQECCPFR